MTLAVPGSGSENGDILMWWQRLKVLKAVP